jgi:hypothetical protein
MILSAILLMLFSLEALEELRLLLYSALQMMK